MPVYAYHCQECEFSVEYRHSVKEVRSFCEKCQKETLRKDLSCPVKVANRKISIKKPTKIGHAVESAIEENRELLKKQQEELKKR